MIEGDRTYLVRVISAQTTKSNEKGTLGLHLGFGCDNGQIGHTIWVTPSSKDNAKKSLLNLGLSEADIANVEFWREPQTFLQSAECSIKTEYEDYQGQQRVRVKWINKAVFIPTAPDDAAEEFARMFGEKF